MLFISSNNLTLDIVFNHGDYLYSDIQVFKFMQLFVSCYQEVTSELIVAALVYINRILNSPSNQGTAKLTETNGKGVLHVALTLATKFNLDRYEKNTIFYGVMSGMDKYRMRKMTDSFLGLLDFNLYISDIEYHAAMSSIKTMIAKKYAMLGQIVINEKNIRKSRGLARTRTLKNQEEFEHDSSHSSSNYSVTS